MEKLAYKLRGCVHIHIWVGLFNALLFEMKPLAALLFGLGFCAYEFIQNQYERDRSDKDVLGWLIGLAFGIIILWLLKYL